MNRAEVIARYRGPRRWFSRIVSEAQGFHRRFTRRRHAREEVLKTLATHALRLAALDYYYRARYLDPHPYKIIRAEVEEIVELLRVVPVAKFRHPEVMMLNPTFGLLSALVGGADADLICGDRFIEIKTVAEGRVKRQDVRQLVGYFHFGFEGRGAGSCAGPGRRLHSRVRLRTRIAPGSSTTTKGGVRLVPLDRSLRTISVTSAGSRSPGRMRTSP